jgi:hypothetical protein
MFKRLLEPDSVRRYRHYRAAELALNNQIMESALPRAVFDRAVRGLGVGAQHQLELESEDELSVLMDYAFYEVGQPGARVVDRYCEQPGGKDQLERELLDAMAASSVGLFRVGAIDKRLCQLTLKQLAPAERDVIITDINFSKSPIQGAVLFSRLLELSELIMTGGAALAFEGEMEAQVVRLWAQSVPRERYRRIFKLHRLKGVPMVYADVARRRRASKTVDQSDFDEKQQP